MKKIKLRKNTRERRRLRIKKKIYGTGDIPRLSIYRSNRYVYGQVIDDTKGHTLVDVFSEAKELHKGKNKEEAAYEVGKRLAEKAKEKNISDIVFDRGGYKYHGRVRKFAEGAREGGLKF